MRICHLHVGTPKTGSTTIQGFLQNRRDVIEARGLGLPTFPPRTIAMTGRQLARHLPLEQDPAAPVTRSWRWLGRHLAATDGDLLITRESLSTDFAKAERFAFVRQFFARRGVRLHIIGYVRDTPDRINATYTQHAKRLRLTRSFNRWIASASPEQNPNFSPWRVFRHMIEADDVDLTLKSFEAVKGRLVEDFLETVGRGDVDARGFDDRSYRNASPGPKAIEAALTIRRRLNERGFDPKALMDYSMAFEAALAERGWNETAFFGPDPALAAQLSARYAEENDRFALAVWGRPWSERVAATDRLRNVFDPKRASLRDLADIDDLARDAIARGDAALRPVSRALAVFTRLRRRLAGVSPRAA
ncbi:hypothetical protein ACFSCV_16030 [Methylopila henanensis]|uniref:Sulfotransferase family protein n=1 Tax=Methylopila henanensis TaxID=873516 RepID=A0ABW4KCT4_9HYPH